MAFNPGTIAKAVVAFVVAGGGTAQAALLDGVVTPTEWIAIAVTAIVAGATVYTVPNDDAKEVPRANGRHRTPTD